MIIRNCSFLKILLITIVLVCSLINPSIYISAGGNSQAEAIKEIIETGSPEQKKNAIILAKSLGLEVNVEETTEYIDIQGNVLSILDPKLIPNYDSPENYKDGEYRFLGVDKNGNYITNPNFPDIKGRDNNYYNRDYLSVLEISCNKNARNLIGASLTTGNSFPSPQDTSIAEKFLEQNPDWAANGWDTQQVLSTFVIQNNEYGVASVRGVHQTASGKLYYKTYNVDTRIPVANITATVTPAPVPPTPTIATPTHTPAQSNPLPPLPTTQNPPTNTSPTSHTTTTPAIPSLPPPPPPPPPEYTLYINNSGRGSVIVNGSSVSLPFSGTYTEGDNVSLSASAAADYNFTGWSGSVNTSSSSTSVAMYSDKSVTANFQTAPRINNISIDAGSLWTYKQNKITIATNIVTDTVRITLNNSDPARRTEFTLYSCSGYSSTPASSTPTCTISSPGQSNTMDSAIYNAQLQVSTHTASGAAKEWVLTFEMNNYKIYDEKMLSDSIRVRAFADDGGASSTVTANAAVKQTILDNLRITAINDIHWQYLFQKQDGSATGLSINTQSMPISSNSKNKLISKGYSVQFKIDSEGLQEAQDRLSIKPTFWWKNAAGQYKEVDLYYDVPDQKVYNIPIHDPEDPSGLQAKINRIQKSFAKYWTSPAYTQSYNKDYGRLTIAPTSVYLENRSDIPEYLLSTRAQNISSSANQYNHTWTFTYSIHPYTKAVLKGENPYGSKGVSGKILMVMKIETIKAKDLSRYNYCKLEDAWGGSTTTGVTTDTDAQLGFDPGLGIGTTGGKILFFNLDKSVIDDYMLENEM